MQLVRPLWILLLLSLGLSSYGAAKAITWLWITGTVLQQLGSLLATIILRAVFDLSRERPANLYLWLMAALAGW